LFFDRKELRFDKVDFMYSMRSTLLLYFRKSILFIAVAVIVASISGMVYANELRIVKHYEGEGNTMIRVTIGGVQHNCGMNLTECTYSGISSGTAISLYVSAAPQYGWDNFHFIGWNGPCYTMDLTCNFSMPGNNVRADASFADVYTPTGAIVSPAPSPGQVIETPVGSSLDIVFSGYRNVHRPRYDVKWLRLCHYPVAGPSGPRIEGGPLLPGFHSCNDPVSAHCALGEGPGGEGATCTRPYNYIIPTNATPGYYMIWTAIEDRRPDRGYACYGRLKEFGWKYGYLSWVEEPFSGEPSAWVGDCSPYQMFPNGDDYIMIYVPLLTAPQQQTRLLKVREKPIGN
jgi:hypothetical protein